MSLFVIKTPAGKVLAEGFDTKAEAKKERDRIAKEGSSCVVSRGSDHWRGETFPTTDCLQTERTSKRKKRKDPVDHGRAPPNPAPPEHKILNK